VVNCNILIIKVDETHYFSALFGKELYTFRTDLVSIRSLKTVFTAIGICHTSYVDSLLARSDLNKYSTHGKPKFDFIENTALWTIVRPF